MYPQHHVTELSSVALRAFALATTPRHLVRSLRTLLHHLRYAHPHAILASRLDLVSDEPRARPQGADNRHKRRQETENSHDRHDKAGEGMQRRAAFLTVGNYRDRSIWRHYVNRVQST